ncbi:hypothetical protein ABPG74_008936 [Tetrahymena malaccensis]
MRNRNASTVNYLKKKKNEFFRISKRFFSWQIYNVTTQIQLLYIIVALLCFIDIIVAIVMGVKAWYIHLLSIIQILLALFVIVAVHFQPLKYESVNLFGCVFIHTIWSIQQTLLNTVNQADSSNTYQTSYYKGEKRESLGYVLGILSYLMIQNTSNFNVKCILLAYNFVLYCAFNNLALYNIQYIIAIFFCACYNLYCDEQGREQLIREAEWMFKLKNVIPNSLLVVQFDRKKKDIDLHMSNEKARHVFNLNGTTLNFIDFCQHVTIQKKIKEEVNDTLFYLEQSNHKSNKSGVGIVNSLHESRIPNSQHKQKEITIQKKTNLYQFLIKRFQELDDELLQKEILRQSSLQSNDKKSTKTNLAAGFINNQGNNVTEFTNKIGGQQASKSFFGQSKTLINMMTSQKSQRKMMMPHHPSIRNKDFSKKFEEYKCVYHRNSQLAHQQQSPQLINQQKNKLYIDEDISDVKFTMKISIYVCIDDYFIVMSLDDSNISEKFQNQTRLSFFYEEFCKQSLLKSTDQVVQLVQEIKQITKQSQIITELDVSRFINSNLYLAESGLSNNLKPTNSNQNIPQPTQTTQNTAGNVVNGSHLTNPTSASQKGVYCIPKRQLDNALQSGILATTVISNFVNYFALRYKKRTQIDEKPFSIIRVIKNVQRIFQKQIDSKCIQVLINSQESHFSNPNSYINVNSNLNNHISSDIRVFINNQNNQANSNNHNTSIININNLNNNSAMNNNLNSSNIQQNMSFSNVSSTVINHLSSSKDNFNNQQNYNNNINNNNNNNFSIREINNQQPTFQNNTYTNQLIAYQVPQRQQCDEITNDEAKLQHLIFNLFQNAVENTPMHGTIAFLIQRDQQLDNCIKIRIRNKCFKNFNFPFLELEEEGINLGWKQMTQEFDQNGKFFFGIRMAAKLSQLIGPYNSLKFKQINSSELQAEFLIYDYSYEKGIFNQNSSTYKSYESSSFLASEKMSQEIKPKRKSTKQRCNSVSSYRVRLDSMDSFDKWIKMQNLESQKGSNTLRIRNQLKYKN